MSCLHVQSTDLSVLHSLTQLTWLSLTADLGNTQQASPRLGANMMVTSAKCHGPLILLTMCSCAVEKRRAMHVHQHVAAQPCRCKADATAMCHGDVHLMRPVMFICVDCFVWSPTPFSGGYNQGTDAQSVPGSSDKSICCMCDKLQFPCAGLASRDTKLRDGRRVPGAAAGLLLPAVAAADGAAGTLLGHRQVLTCLPVCLLAQGPVFCEEQGATT